MMKVGLGSRAGETGVEPREGRGQGFKPPTPGEINAHFPQLEILELLGQGGMGAVYKARQKQLDRLVALKVLPRSVESDPSFAERFAREAKALAKLNHPHIVTLYEFGQAKGIFYFLMEFVDGVNLRQLQGASRLTPEQALAIVPQICDALQYAHQRGIVHRDIKPENILLSSEGVVKIADFGVAKIIAPSLASAEEPPSAPAATRKTSVTGMVGTPQYMAPEQVQQPATVDHRADIYSLGVVFYEMLTGELPGEIFAPPSRKVQMDVRIDEIVLRALEKNPALRYQQASVLKTDVETMVQSSETPRPPAPPIHALRTLYKDRLIEITDQEIVFHRYYLPFGSDRHVPWSHIESIQVRPPSLSSGSWRLWGCEDFLRTWYPLDFARPSRDRIFLLCLRGRSRRIGFTVEDSSKVMEILKARGLLREAPAA
jgi:serine/threonine protein kinase